MIVKSFFVNLKDKKDAEHILSVMTDEHHLRSFGTHISLKRLPVAVAGNKVPNAIDLVLAAANAERPNAASH